MSEARQATFARSTPSPRYLSQPNPAPPPSQRKKTFNPNFPALLPTTSSQQAHLLSLPRQCCQWKKGPPSLGFHAVLTHSLVSKQAGWALSFEKVVNLRACLFLARIPRAPPVLYCKTILLGFLSHCFRLGAGYHQQHEPHDKKMWWSSRYVASVASAIQINFTAS